MTKRKNYIIRIIRMTPALVPVIARMHAVNLPTTLSSKLGIKFLEALYRCLIDDPHSLCLVAVNVDNEPIASITATIDLRKSFELQKRLQFTPLFFIGVIGSIFSGSIRVGEIVRRSRFESFLLKYKTGRYASILTLFVSSECRKRGIARMLISSVICKVQGFVDSLYVDTERINIPAIRVYTKSGFSVKTEKFGNVILEMVLRTQYR